MATPYARKFLGLDAGGIGEMLRNLPNQAIDMGRLMLKLPRALDQLITRLETGQLEVKLAPEALSNGRGRRRGRRNGNGNGHNNGSGTSGLSWVLLAAVTMAGGIFLLVSAHLPVPGWFLLALTGASGLRLILRR
jgi:hypothetical protein